MIAMTPKERILVVDDDPEAREVLCDALAHMGYAVETASGGYDALAVLRSWPADVVVSDIQMPDMTGLDLIRELRMWGLGQPVVLVTGGEPGQTAPDAYGAEAFLQKPLGLDDLVWAIDCAIACRSRGTSRHEVSEAFA
jgi:DNA-binding NtrC family response regulator